jgi:hypothetical protein
MGILQNPLGINLTNNMPLIHGPFGNSDFGEGGFPPFGTFHMITEGGDQMITETTLDDMITE